MKAAHAAWADAASLSHSASCRRVDTPAKFLGPMMPTSPLTDDINDGTGSSETPRLSGDSCHSRSLGFRLDTLLPATILAQSVADFLSPEAIGLLHIVPGICHAAQALGAATAIHRLEYASVALSVILISTLALPVNADTPVARLFMPEAIVFGG